MASKQTRVTWTIILLIGLAALFAGIFVAQHLKKPVDHLLHGTLLEKPREITAFELVGMDQHKFNKDNLRGQWTMVFFGFTSCGSICPTTMAELAEMYRILEHNKVKNLPRVVMVSIDPERDSLEKLNSYVTAFNPHFYGARGSEAAIQSMTRELGVAYARIVLNSSEPDKYEMEHTGTVMLFNPNGDLTAFFTMPHQAKFLAEDYQLLTS